MQSSQKQPRQRRGTTLIEVLAGLIILGTLLVSVSIARGRFLNQWAESDQRLRATKSTDKLLSTWLSGSPETVPVQSEGPLPEMPGFLWQTHTLRDSEVQTLSAVVVRLQIFDRRPTVQGAPPIGIARGPILSIDFLLHRSPPKILLNQPR